MAKFATCFSHFSLVDHFGFFHLMQLKSSIFGYYSLPSKLPLAKENERVLNVINCSLTNKTQKSDNSQMFLTFNAVLFTGK